MAQAVTSNKALSSGNALRKPIILPLRSGAAKQLNRNRVHAQSLFHGHNDRRQDLVAYSLCVAGFTMLGARLGQRVGPLRMFRWMTAVFLAAMVVMTTSASTAVMIAAQALAGLASAAIIPSLVVLTAHHYKGKQQATALVVGILSASIQRALVDNPTIPSALISQVDLDNVRFVSNDRLLDTMSRTTATPDQVDAALQINADARLRALNLTFLLLTGLGLLAFVPAGRLPDYKPDEVPG